MPMYLRAAQATVSAINQTVDSGGKITAYVLSIAIRFIDDQGSTVTTITQTVDAWPLLPQARQTQLQAIQDMITTQIAATYLN